MHDIRPLTRDENASLYQRLRNGDQKALEQMILGNLRLVHRKVRSFLRGSPRFAYLIDDLTSEGFLGLSQAVHALAESEEESTNVVSYLCTAIKNAISAAAQTEDTIMSPQARHYARSKGEEIPTWKRLPFSVLYRVEVDFHGPVDARDTIYSCAKTPEDRRLLEMREMGYSYSKIAEALGCPDSTAEARGGRLYRRAKEKIKAETFKE